MTALDALEAALRPSQAAEDVLSRLIAMGWTITRLPAAEDVPGTIVWVPDVPRPSWLRWLLGRVG